MGILGIWSDKNNTTEHISSAYSCFMQLCDLINITFIFSLVFPLLFKVAFGILHCPSLKAMEKKGTSSV